MIHLALSLAALLFLLWLGFELLIFFGELWEDGHSFLVIGGVVVLLVIVSALI